MKLIPPALLFISALFVFIGISPAQTASIIEPLPEITLTIPDNQEHIDYMGLAWGPGTPFKLNNIDADILLVELFSMYCPYCQKAAPKVNELFELMEKKKSPDLKLVIVGIGTNNTELEVETFREGFGIKFPLFADKNMEIYKALAGAGTPTFIGIRNEGGRPVIFYRKAGGFTDASEILEKILAQSQLK